MWKSSLRKIGLLRPANGGRANKDETAAVVDRVAREGAPALLRI